MKYTTTTTITTGKSGRQSVFSSGILTYSDIALERRAVADNVVHREADWEGNALENGLAILALVLEDGRSLLFDERVAELAELDNLSARNNLDEDALRG
eukprot:scaffold7151_cov159-Ochromonas_danica.AAC.5